MASQGEYALEPSSGSSEHPANHPLHARRRAGAGIRVMTHGDAAEMGRPHGGFAYYIDVRDLGQVLVEIGPKLAQLPAADVCGPHDQSYGQRELMVRAPDGNLIVFGQPIPA